MSEAFRNSTGSIGTVCEITKYATEIESLLGGATVSAIVTTDPTIEDPSEFAMEKHLEDFLVENWEQTELGKDYDIFEEEGEPVGQQYETGSGPLDILAISKNKKKLLVVELKKGRASDAVVGQVLRYMDYVKDELAEDGQTVEGIIIAQEDESEASTRHLNGPFDQILPLSGQLQIDQGMMNHTRKNGAEPFKTNEKLCLFISSISGNGAFPISSAI